MAAAGPRGGSGRQGVRPAMAGRPGQGDTRGAAGWAAGSPSGVYHLWPSRHGVGQLQGQSASCLQRGCCGPSKTLSLRLPDGLLARAAVALLGSLSYRQPCWQLSSILSSRAALICRVPTAVAASSLPTCSREVLFASGRKGLGGPQRRKKG